MAQDNSASIILSPREEDASTVSSHLADQVAAIKAELSQREAITGKQRLVEAAAELLGTLRQARLALMTECAKLGNVRSELNADLRRSVILEHSGSPETGGKSALKIQGELETVCRKLDRSREALEYLNTHAVPVAIFRHEEARADFLVEMSAALEDVAQRRLEAVMDKLGGIVHEEGVFAFDPSKSFSGELLNQSNRFALEADSVRQHASALREKYLAGCLVMRTAPIDDAADLI
jgi:hypothetical protein